jgi:hypothetical protein
VSAIGGSFEFYDTSANLSYVGYAQGLDVNTTLFVTQATQLFSGTIASGDALLATLIYERT